ncbi:MAG: hypothetical protein A2286_03975 [Gammaproteobacteria bacterium RIFOXYA12_FULL_61_12]|nr:MAG: hypothetical protein A2514_14520 [Gammaproteobacteria bacterium RIFOXYD12_FULL_61_37]OGT94456.1 MAG: hypothetical protein A2286_03975 [Gammaproteobacteria bacterium RIFOXYA12_FULL_61_12]
MIKLLSIGAALASALLVTGCASSPQASPDTEEIVKIVWDEQWDFDAYRITEGQGQAFSGAGKSYVILPGGIKARQVAATGDPAWNQQGAVIHIDGQPQKIRVQSEGGSTLGVELIDVSPQSAPPAAGPAIPSSKPPSRSVVTALSPEPASTPASTVTGREPEQVREQNRASNPLGVFPQESRK